MPEPRPQIVTAVEPQRGKRKRLNVYLNDFFAFSIDPLVAEKFRLAPGLELTEAQIASLSDQDDAAKAYDAALLLLRYRRRTRKEMEQRLAQRGFPAEVVAATLSRLEEQQLIDDRTFVEFWKEDRESLSPRGKRLMGLELRKVGVDRQTIEEGLKDVDERQSARKAAESKLRLWGGLEYDSFRQKMGSFLARRGYSWSVVKEVVESVWTDKSG